VCPLQVATVFILHVKGLAIGVCRAGPSQSLRSITDLAEGLDNTIIIFVVAVDVVARDAGTPNQLKSTCNKQTAEAYRGTFLLR
jgi:hypothetical protein